jgi:NTP pyrophosphatase (non-canonical NTP hydrolase)
MQNDVLELVKQLSQKDTKTLSQKALKLASECGELASKALAYDNLDGDRHRFISKEAILDEVADTMLVALSIAYSLGYTDSDISSMMKDKAIHWSHLKEQDISDGNYPFEIHFTVLAKHLGGFIKNCEKWGDMKPIVLDLYNQDSGIGTQVTTSTVIFGTLVQAISKMNFLSMKLRNNGYEVIREKIETVPWHPAIGSMNGKYFESHIPIFLESKDVLENLRNTNINDLHISKNVLKPDLDGISKIFATIRSEKGSSLIKHQLVLNMKLASLELYGFKMGKTITEYAILDSNEELDARWLGKTINII